MYTSSNKVYHNLSFVCLLLLSLFLTLAAGKGIYKDCQCQSSFLPMSSFILWLTQLFFFPDTSRSSIYFPIAFLHLFLFWKKSHRLVVLPLILLNTLLFVCLITPGSTSVPFTVSFPFSFLLFPSADLQWIYRILLTILSLLLLKKTLPDFPS